MKKSRYSWFRAYWMECLSLPQVRFVYYLVKTNYGIIWTEPWIVMFCRTVITFVFSQISVIDKAIFSVFPKNYFWSHWVGTLEQMCYLTIRTCKTKALPQSSKQINGTITITWQSYQNKIIKSEKIPVFSTNYYYIWFFALDQYYRAKVGILK